MSPRRIVLAPNAFKGTFDAVEVARLWEESLAGRAGVIADPHPVSDGGDGFLAVMERALPDLLVARAKIRDPLGRPVSVRWGWDPGSDEAWIESAEAVGLARLAEDERDPEAATSYGLGQLLGTVAGLGVRRVVVGLGGSATVDGGLGMARALGYRYQSADGTPIERPRDLARLARMIPPEADPLEETSVVALADVRNPLSGPGGAARVFGPQKGAGTEAVERLAAGLERAAERWAADLGAPADLPDRPGAGAAGGLGAALVALAGARLEWGPAWIAERTGLDAALEGAAAVITGEGRFDAQSAADKATGRVISVAAREGVPVALVAGAIAADADLAGTAVALDARDLGLEPGTRLDAEGLKALMERAVERILLE